MAKKGQAPPDQITLFNAVSRRPEVMGRLEAERALLQGSHGFESGVPVNMIKPDGTAVSINSDDVAQYMRDIPGARLESQEERAIADYVAENDSASGALSVAAKEFANQALFGVPGVAADRLQDPFDVKKREALNAQHRAAQIAGGVAGFGASLFTGAPIFRGAAAAGQAAERAIARGLTKTAVAEGASQGAARSMGQALAKPVSKLGGMAVEGAASMAPIAITEAGLGDPNAAAESLLWGAGIGSVLGTGIAGASKVFQGINGVYRSSTSWMRESATPNLGPLAQAMPDRPIAKPSAAVAETAADATPPRAFQNIDEAAVARMQAAEISKSNVISARLPQREAAAANVARKAGLDQPLVLTPGIRTDNKALKQMESAITNATMSEEGIKRQMQYDEIFAANEVALAKVLAADGIQSQDELAAAIRQGADDALKAAHAGIDEAYQAFERNLKSIALKDDEALTVFDRLERKLQQIQGKERLGVDAPVIREANELLRSVLSRLDENGSVTAAAIYDTSQDVAAKIRSVFDQRVVGPGEAKRGQVLLQVQEALDSALSDIVEQRAKQLVEEGLPNAVTLAQELLELRDVADLAYRQFKQEQKPIARILGISDKAGFKKFREGILSGKTDAALIKKIESAEMDLKDLMAIKEASPALFDIIARVKKQALLRKSITSSKTVSIRTVLEDVFKMDRKVRDLLFGPEDLQLVDDIFELIDPIPKNINPSGTAKGLAAQQLLTGGQAAAALADPTGFLLFSAIEKGLVKGQTAAMNAALEELTKTSGVTATHSQMSLLAKALVTTDRFIQSALTKPPQAARKYRPQTTNALTRIIEAMQVNVPEDADNAAKLKALDDSLGEFVNNPERASERLDDMFGGFGAMGAPTVSAMASQKAFDAAAYLKSQMPKTVVSTSPFDTSPPRVSSAELASFNRKLEMVINPEKVGELMDDGVLTRDHVEALRTVYPTLYGVIASRTMRFAEENAKKLNYQSSLKMSLLVGLNLHSSLNPQNIAAAQQTFSAQSVADMAEETQRRSVKMSSRLARSELTEGQRLTES